MEKDYKQEVISLIDNCSNDNFLKFLFELVTSFKKKGGNLMPLFLIPIGYVVKYSLLVLFIKFS